MDFFFDAFFSLGLTATILSSPFGGALDDSRGVRATHESASFTRQLSPGNSSTIVGVTNNEKTLHRTFTGTDTKNCFPTINF